MQLYQEFYNLKDYPFRLTPDPAFLCMTAQHREALSGLVFSVCTRPGLTVLVGEAGTGKTTLLYSLTELLEKRRFVTAVCNNPMLTREEFFDLLLAKLGIECESSLKSRQLAALQEGLLKYRAEGRPAVLIVDEAQRLPAELLEEIRLLLNLETPREKLLEIILAGQPELSEILARPELRQLKQRVSCVCRLKPLSPEEVREYLFHRLAHAGLSQQSLFPDEVLDLIIRYTQGIPRLINSLCDSCLQLGFALQSPRITPAIVAEAAGDLDLIPPPPPKRLEDRIERSIASMGILDSIPERAPRPEIPEVVPVVQRQPNGDSNGVVELHVPLESYAKRQKSMGTLASLIDRWR
jgi:general secretion pathway protein A